MSDPSTPTRPDALPVPEATADPLPPPVWATRSIPEDGGVTHEIVSRLQPVVRRWDGDSTSLYPTEVSLSVTDLPTDGRWTRSAPTIQVEAGSYPPDSARHLCDALVELLSHVDTDPTPADHRHPPAIPRTAAE